MQLLDIYQAGDSQKAADILQPLIDENPFNLEIQRQQAYFYLRAGTLTKRARVSARSLAADPKDTRSLFYLAESLNDLEQYERRRRTSASCSKRLPTIRTSWPASA